MDRADGARTGIKNIVIFAIGVIVGVLIAVLIWG